MKKTDSPIYNAILSLPLLKGASVARLTDIVGRYKLNFLKFQPGETIVTAGDECKSLIFILSGSICLTANAPREILTVKQTLDAPQVIFPDRLFGRENTYPTTVTALSAVSVLEISKEIYRKMLADDPVFLYNYLNRVCSAAQRNSQPFRNLTDMDNAKRLARWISELTLPGAKDIHIYSESADLADILAPNQPEAWNQAIEQLRSRGLIAYVTRRSFAIPSRTLLHPTE